LSDAVSSGTSWPNWKMKPKAVRRSSVRLASLSASICWPSNHTCPLSGLKMPAPCLNWRAKAVTSRAKVARWALGLTQSLGRGLIDTRCLNGEFAQGGFFRHAIMVVGVQAT